MARRGFALITKPSRPIPQVGLHVVVIADEISAQASTDRIEYNTQTQTGANLVKPGSQTPQRIAAMRVRVPPQLRQHSQRAVNRCDFGGTQLLHEAEKALGQQHSRRRWWPEDRR